MGKLSSLFFNRKEKLYKLFRHAESKKKIFKKDGDRKATPLPPLYSNPWLPEV